MPTALITGASTGIGREFANLCARDGYHLILVARDRERLQSVAAELRQHFSRDVYVLAKDLARPEAPKEIFDELSAAGVSVDVLINNAGFGLLGRFAEQNENAQMSMIEVNVAALTALTRFFLPGMLSRHGGRILNVASTAAFQPGPLMAIYYATKAYVVSFSHAVHNECKGTGVTVTALCPGPTHSEFAERAGMTKTRLFKSSLAMSASEVARIGYEAMRTGKPVVVTGAMNATTAFLTRFIPAQWAATIARKLQES